MNPFVDLGVDILREFGAPASISVSRRSAGSYDQSTGSWSQGAETVLSIEAAVFPASPRTLQQLDIGERTSEGIEIFTTSPLQSSDSASGLAADIVTWASKTYKVAVVEDWTAQARYARAVATRVGV